MPSFGDLPHATNGQPLTDCPGEAAVVLTRDGGVDAVGFLTVEDDLVTAMYLVRNPEKLGAV